MLGDKQLEYGSRYCDCFWMENPGADIEISTNLHQFDIDQICVLANKEKWSEQRLADTIHRVTYLKNRASKMLLVALHIAKTGIEDWAVTEQDAGRLSDSRTCSSLARPSGIGELL